MFDKQKGVCKWFNNEKGYGFIIPQGGGKDIFIHVNQLQKSGIKSLKEGQHLTFETREERGKITACNVSLIGS